MKEITDAREKEIIEKLATGYVIRMEDSRDWCPPDYYLERDEPRTSVSGNTLMLLMRDGLIESFPGGYRLTDKGKRMYLRSTDELQDGKMLFEVCEHG